MWLYPSRNDRTQEGLDENDLIIGWSKVKGLLDPGLTRDGMRELVYAEQSSDKKSLKKAGRDAGELWRFIREMSVGDLVAVPHNHLFHVAEVLEAPRFEASKVSDDTAYRRRVRWLDGRRGVPRSWASPVLRRKLGLRYVCWEATELLSDIREALKKSEGLKEERSNSDGIVRIGPVAILDDKGTQLDATFSVEPFSEVVTVILEARGGAAGKKGARNQDYQEGLRLILARLKKAGVRLADVQVDSKVVRHMGAEDRRLKIPGTEYPIAILDPVDLQRSMGRAQALIGRAPGAKGPGNPTKRLRLYLEFPGEKPAPLSVAAYLGAGGEIPRTEASPRSSSVGGKYRKADPKHRDSRTKVFEVDPDRIDRGTHAHAATQEALAAFLRKKGIDPRSYVPGEPEYDLSWERASVVYVAEVKSITAANGEKQLRLGLGQVLRYKHQLEQRCTKKVVAVLVAESRPSDKSWISTCRSHGVLLAWPGRFEHLLED